LLGTVRPYVAAATYADGGTQPLVVTDPRRRDVPMPELEPAMAETARAAHLAGVGAVETSLPLVRGHLWLRVFATSLPPSAQGPSSLALLVDTAPLLDKLKLVAADSSTQLLVLGPHGRPAPSSSSPLIELVATAPHTSRLGGLLEGMRAGRSGTIRIDEREAVALGFAPGDLIAAFSPVRVAGGKSWSVATFTSLSLLRNHERAIILRIAFSAVLVAAVLGGFGAYVLRSTRRQALLSERLRHAGEVSRLNEQLLQAEKLTTVGVLAAGIAHEIGTPLGVVRGRAEYALGKLGEDHPQAGSQHVIIEQIDRIVRTIRELLDFSRAKPVAVTPVELVGVVDKSADLLRYEVERRGLTLAVDVDAGLPLIAADADQLQQVLVNVMMNAFDACDAGGHVAITARRGERGIGRAGLAGVRIEVADNGCGIPEENIHRVFDPFFTTKKRGKGTGLGLSIVAQIIRSHGAEISLESEPRCGTRVLLDWPVAEVQHAAA
jgi:signal transduction histidine kinase